MYQEQIERIKHKLAQARNADVDLTVFGADSHEYQIGKCVTPKELMAFEQQYQCKLPLCYKTFLLAVGNGGVSYNNSAAGPSYGIYPLNKHVDEIVKPGTVRLGLPAQIYPDMSDEAWDELTQPLDDDLSDDLYDSAMSRFFAGVLPIGSQGCTYIQALIVTGKHAGKVVNFDLAMYKPHFCFEANFLDWYERWLNEIISGDLLEDSPSLFGCSMGGTAAELINDYDKAADLSTKTQALQGMFKLKSADESSCEALKSIGDCSNTELKFLATQLLTKFSYPMAIKQLSELIDSDDESCLAACQAIYMYQRAHAGDWLDQLRVRLKRVKNEDTFSYMSFLLGECGIDFGSDLLAFAQHENPKIRADVFYSLSELPNRKKYLNVFVDGLLDESSHVVHTTLQALEGINEPSLLKTYYQVIQNYPKEKNYILVNLNHRLEEQGFNGRADFLKRYDPVSDAVQSRTDWLISSIKRFFTK